MIIWTLQQAQSRVQVELPPMNGMSGESHKTCDLYMLAIVHTLARARARKASDIKSSTLRSVYMSITARAHENIRYRLLSYHRVQCVDRQ